MHTDLTDRGFAASDDDSWTPEATNSPMTGSRPVSSGVTLMTWPGFRPQGSFVSVDAFAIEVALLATSSACSEAIGLRWPWPIAANPLGRAQQPWKAIERRRPWSEVLLQEPNRMVGGEIGEASCRALQE
jgi:hypothetical protein